MDSEEGQSPSGSQEQQRNVQVDNAIRAIREKKPLPEVDFSLHTLESGEQVSTMERVCKGTSHLLPRLPPCGNACVPVPQIIPPLLLPRCRRRHHHGRRPPASASELPSHCRVTPSPLPSPASPGAQHDGRPLC